MKAILSVDHPVYSTWFFKVIALVFFCGIVGFGIAQFIVHVCAKQHPATTIQLVNHKP